ncbi:MAG: phosphotransferase [Actinobacteria bacterium]|nr:phosphotransferase [Actinomycetota bacterium]
MDWAPEHEIRTEQAARLIATQFPALAALPVVPLATGWDNSVFTVGDAWAFRFPRRETALPGIRREISLLPLLARRLPLPVPVPELLGVPAESFPWPFTGNRFVHARTQPHVEAIAHLWQPDEAVRALYEEACGLPPWSGEPVLVHGDLHLRHLLVAPDGAATGVIDWGDVCLADASVDLMLVYGGFTGTARDAFFDAYGPVTRAQELRARVLSVGVCAALAVSAPEASALQHEALRGLVRSVS